MHSDWFIDLNVDNVKGTSTARGHRSRFIDILSDPSNSCIDRVPNAGEIINGHVVMHNGLLIEWPWRDTHDPERAKGYYGAFSEILRMNKGVHEPSEERMFATVLKKGISDGATMVELGSYWAFYSMWFYKAIKDAQIYCIEPVEEHLNMGISHCKLNDVQAKFTQGKADVLHQVIQENNIEYIDLLHADIQGGERELLKDISSLLMERKIKYLFVSTHGDECHYECIKHLEDHEYRIVASADCETETFCFDGIIVACHQDNLDVPFISLGNRRHTPLATHPLLSRDLGILKFYDE